MAEEEERGWAKELSMELDRGEVAGELGTDRKGWVSIGGDLMWMEKSDSGKEEWKVWWSREWLFSAMEERIRRTAALPLSFESSHRTRSRGPELQPYWYLRFFSTLTVCCS